MNYQKAMKVPCLYNMFIQLFPQSKLLSLTFFFSKILKKDINIYCVSIMKGEENISTIYVKNFRECIDACKSLIDNNKTKKSKDETTSLVIQKADIIYIPQKEPLISYTKVYEKEIEDKPLYPEIIASAGNYDLIAFFTKSKKEDENVIYQNIYHIFDRVNKIMHSLETGKIKFNVKRKKELESLLKSSCTNIIDISGRKVSLRLFNPGRGFLLMKKSLYFSSTDYYVFREEPVSSNLLSYISFELLKDNKVCKLACEFNNYIKKDVLDSLFVSPEIVKDNKTIKLQVLNDNNTISYNIKVYDRTISEDNHQQSDEKPPISNAFKTI